MRALNLTIKTRRPGFDIDVMNSAVVTMPMEECLELMAVISPYGIDPEWELVNYVIDKINGVFLGMAPVYPQSPDSGGIINSGVLKTPNPFSIFSRKEQEFNIHLDVMAGDLLFVALMGLYGAELGIAGQAA
jgi:hypothetical protein